MVSIMKIKACSVIDQQVEHRPAEMHQLAAQECQAAHQQHFSQQQPKCLSCCPACLSGSATAWQIRGRRDNPEPGRNVLAKYRTEAGRDKPEPAVKISAIRIKISSPAYMLPNSRRPSDTGLASRATVSSSRLGMKEHDSCQPGFRMQRAAGQFSDETATPLNLMLKYRISTKTVSAMPMVALTSVVGTTFW